MRFAALLITFTVLFWCHPAQARRRHKHPVLRMEATAFARAPQLTASGTDAHFGIVAADPGILPMGTRIRIERAGVYNGDYLVTDTGAAIKGRHIDIYLPSIAEAKRFGNKKVRVVVLEVGDGKADAREKDEADREAHR
jgi:3D (Asp-Asp-Asp) domain-containing protein